MTQTLSPIMPPEIRHAATIILLRESADETSVLMGQRGKSAAFMPGKFVFPGGAVDPQDFAHSEQPLMTAQCFDRLCFEATPELAAAILVAARRELREETGLTLLTEARMRFVFRAITPPKRTRRFDARFFLCDADDVQEDLDDFSRAEDELSHLHWVSLSDALSLDLPFVTRIVLSEIKALAAQSGPPSEVPFYDHRTSKGSIVSIR
jgi:8-oxo-dGTP pyrophosphatase MutT (NUDIX family)